MAQDQKSVDVQSALGKRQSSNTRTIDNKRTQNTKKQNNYNPKNKNASSKGKTLSAGGNRGQNKKPQKSSDLDSAIEKATLQTRPKSTSSRTRTKNNNVASNKTNNQDTKKVSAQPNKKQSNSKNTQQAATTQSKIQSESAQKKPVRSNTTRKPRTQKGRKQAEKPVRIIPLGGLNEIGKNITVYEYNNQMFIVDCGLSFPDAELFGVDLVIPDFTYLIENKEKIKGIFLTHGHEDHIGALPYLLKQINVPVYGTRLTLSLVEGKLEEHGILRDADLHIIKSRDKIKVAGMEVECVHVNHSIPDALAFAIHTPVGTIFQTGDFKVDFTPIREYVIDLNHIAAKGTAGIKLLLSDSTNAESQGFSKSESTVGLGLETVFSRAVGRRILIASFASNVYRLQQIINTAKKYNRKVAVSGRSMVNMAERASALGYLTIPKGVLIELDDINNYNPEQLCILTTGSQGEPMAALSRMAEGSHKQVKVGNNDVVVFSSKTIPGNEKMVNRVVNGLLKVGAQVIYGSDYNIHVSGHANQEELRLMLNLTRPEFFLPVHGEFKHLKKHAQIAVDMGVKEQNIVIGDIGQVYELTSKSFKHVDNVPAGRVLVDGLGVGDVGSIVLRDRKHLSQDGLIVIVCTIDSNTGEFVSGPDIVSRGFVYVRESEELMAELRQLVEDTLQDCERESIKEWGAIKVRIREAMSKRIWERTKRSPMILPIITEL